MLSFKPEGNADALVQDTNTDKVIYHVDERDVPGILTTSPMSLLDKSMLFRLKRKYGLTKRFLASLNKAYSKKEEFFTPPTKHLNEELAVQEIETFLLNRMKFEFRGGKEYKFLPVYDFSTSHKTALHTTFVSSSSAGKSYLCSQFILKNVKFPRKRKVYVILASPEQDEPWRNFRKDYSKMGGKCVMIDANELTRSGDVSISNLSKSSIVVIDDQEVVDNNMVLTRLSRRILIEGRKWGTPEMGGLTLFSVMHSLHAGASTKWHATESNFVLFTKSNQTLARKIMRTKLGFNSKLIEKCISLGGRGRYAYIFIRNSPSPTFVSSSEGVFLL